MINYISYEYGSNKGQTNVGDMFASSLNMGVSDPNYSANVVDNETLEYTSGSTTITGKNVQWTPVRPGSFYVSADGGTVTGHDDGNGTISGTGVSGTIDYATGEISLTFTAAPADAPMASYIYNNEDVSVVPQTKIPEVNLKITSLPVVAQSRKMKAVYAFDAKLMWCH